MMSAWNIDTRTADGRWHPSEAAPMASEALARRVCNRLNEWAVGNRLAPQFRVADEGALAGRLRWYSLR